MGKMPVQKCEYCGVEFGITGIEKHQISKHPIDFAKKILSKNQINYESSGVLADVENLKTLKVALEDSVKIKNSEIVTLKDSLTKSDAAFLEVTAELAKLNDRPISDGMILDFINNRLDEDTWAKIGTIKKFGLATVEDSAELKDTPQPQDELLPNKVQGTTQGGVTAARDAHNVEAEGSTPSPATKPEGTAPVADVESPGEKWWNDFCQKI